MYLLSGGQTGHWTGRFVHGFDFEDREAAA
jgi:hypothetical protein